MAILRLIAVILLVCAPPAAAAPGHRSVRIDGIPHVRQKPDFCGEACAEMMLRKLGTALDQDDVFDRSGLDPMLGRGCYAPELVRALKDLGFRVGDVWRRVPAGDAAALDAPFKFLHADLAAGVPSIVCTRYDEQPGTSEHFRLVTGYDADTDEVVYHEPAADDGAGRRMKRERLLGLWPLKYDAREWTVIRIRMEHAGVAAGGADALRPSPRPAGARPADYAQHVMELKKKLPGREFNYTLEPPFVVIGDEPQAMLRRRAAQTVRWAVDALKRDYFEKDPDRILDVWLFKDKASYEKHTKSVFGDEPSTPFGYYSERHGALIMNIATGGGTLVHEIVHPFMAANFPECPSWFNEGLGSLYEQSGERDGHIIGLTNWRLRGLQAAIREGNVPSFKTLCGTTTDEFYGDDRGTNYAQARYLCHYLQEKGLLVKYFHAFRKAVKDDPGGYRTLVGVLGNPDMGAFQKAWEAYVMGLRFR